MVTKKIIDLEKIFIIEKENKTMDKILIFLLIVYGISVAIFGLYYNYEYAQTHGFLSWLLFGEIIATLKALVWPLFEFGII